ncbi:DUF2515 family protein [Sediminibacillus massiliensis]|uniref:DUF2515 family protein n=1 Tax=Sediminibacillus massiliensis TaxID=1926277 RepID=UPI0015C3205E|nr:DUF2515 family protein [Sediminibacillus massiliensis]
MVERINNQTSHCNRNNLTRTEAYRQFYFKHPEIHWAFLAHMVSRNGGWSMTDLKGEFLPHLLTARKREHFFAFFERANALIFQDAYPQLLLYEESKKRGENLFYLLPVFHVSKFMKLFWDNYLEGGMPQLLTLALIINEQNYIENRVVQNYFFQDNVVKTWQFKGQEAMNLTQVLLPGEGSPKAGNPTCGSNSG